MPVLVDFWADWCGPCRMISPIVERIGAAEAGRLKVVKLDVERAPELAARHGAQSIPLLVLFRDGEEVDRLVGAVPERQLRQWLEPHLTPAGERRRASRRLGGWPRTAGAVKGDTLVRELAMRDFDEAFALVGRDRGGRRGPLPPARHVHLGVQPGPDHDRQPAPCRHHRGRDSGWPRRWTRSIGDAGVSQADAASVYLQLGAVVFALGLGARLAGRLGSRRSRSTCSPGSSSASLDIPALSGEFVGFAAELGVILLLFLIGLEYTAEELTGASAALPPRSPRSTPC